MHKYIILTILIFILFFADNLYGLNSGGLCLRPPVLSGSGDGLQRVRQISTELPEIDPLSFSSPYAVFQALARSDKPLTPNMISEIYGVDINEVERNLSRLAEIGLVAQDNSLEGSNTFYKISPKVKRWKAKVLQNLAQLLSNPQDSDWQFLKDNLNRIMDYDNGPNIQLSMVELKRLERAGDINALKDSVMDLFGASLTISQLNSLEDMKAYKEIEEIIKMSEDAGVIFDGYYILKNNDIAGALERLNHDSKLKRRLAIISMASDDSQEISNALSVLSEIGGWDNLLDIILTSNKSAVVCLGIQELERFGRAEEIKTLRLDSALKIKLIEFISKAGSIYEIRQGIKALKIVEEKETLKNSLEAVALGSTDNIIAVRESIASLESLNAEDHLNRIAEKFVDSFLKGTNKDSIARWLGLGQYGKDSALPSFQNLLERWLKKRVKFQERPIPLRQPDFIWGRDARSRAFRKGDGVLVAKRLDKGEGFDRQLLRMTLAGVLLAGSGIDDKEISIPVMVGSDQDYGYVTKESTPQNRITNSGINNIRESLKNTSERLAMLYRAGCWLSLVPATHRLPVGDEPDMHRFMWQNAVGADRDIFKPGFNLITLGDTIEKIGEVVNPIDFIVYANIYRDGSLADLEDVRIGQGPFYPTSVARRAGQTAFEFIFITMRSIALNDPVVSNDLLSGKRDSLISQTLDSFIYFWACFLQRGIAPEEIEIIKLQLTEYINNDENAWVWDINKNPPYRIITRNYYQIWDVAWIFASKIYERGEEEEEGLMLESVRDSLMTVQAMYEDNGSEPVLVDDKFYFNVRHHRYLDMKALERGRVKEVPGTGIYTAAQIALKRLDFNIIESQAGQLKTDFDKFIAGFSNDVLMALGLSKGDRLTIYVSIGGVLSFDRENKILTVPEGIAEEAIKNPGSFVNLINTHRDDIEDELAVKIARLVRLENRLREGLSNLDYAFLDSSERKIRKHEKVKDLWAGASDASVRALTDNKYKLVRVRDGFSRTLLELEEIDTEEHWFMKLDIDPFLQLSSVYLARKLKKICEEYPALKRYLPDIRLDPDNDEYYLTKMVSGIDMDDALDPIRNTDLLPVYQIRGIARQAIELFDILENSELAGLRLFFGDIRRFRQYRLSDVGGESMPGLVFIDLGYEGSVCDNGYGKHMLAEFLFTLYTLIPEDERPIISGPFFKELSEYFLKENGYLPVSALQLILNTATQQNL